jgi:putative transcriptional regulator
MIKARRLPDGSVVQILPGGSTQPLEDTSDWSRFDGMTEEELEANALADPDNPPLSEEALARFRSVPNPKEIRRRLHMTQAQFALRFQLPLGTLRDWEQGVRQPDSAAKSYLRVIAKNPEAVLKALEEA